jgi:uncharacterized RDD family membrane protein YckC
VKQTTLSRYVVGAALVLTLVMLYGLSPVELGVGYQFVNGVDSYSAGSGPLHLLLSPLIIGLYVWILRTPLQDGRSFVAAGLWRRFWAFVADFMFGMFVLMPWIGLIALLAEAGRTGHFTWTLHRQPALEGDGDLAGMLVLSAILLLLGFFILPLRLRRATPGCVLLGIAVRYDSGKPPSVLGALGRTFLAYMALGGCFISAPMALSDPGKRMWQDKACDSRVVQWTD